MLPMSVLPIPCPLRRIFDISAPAILVTIVMDCEVFVRSRSLLHLHSGQDLHSLTPLLYISPSVLTQCINISIATISPYLARFEAMYSLIYTVCLLSIFVSVHADAGLASQQQPIQTSSNPFDPLFDDYVEDLLKECHVPGVSIAVVDNGKISSKVSLPRPCSTSSSSRPLVRISI